MATVDGEVDTCRICSAPAEEGQPLFYPCKCSGTIRYIHQDCLTTWLAHSKKRSCDVCKFEYSFTKVYKDNMPKRLPPQLFLKKLSVHLARIVILALRLVMISIIWLAILPYVTLLVWRFYFWTGEALAYWVVGKEIPQKAPMRPIQSNATTAAQQSAGNGTSIEFEHTWLSDKLPADLGVDIFKGQIITIAVVIVFLTVFLLREWIIQNARPGVFGDEDVLEGEAAVPNGIVPEAPQEAADPVAVVVEDNRPAAPHLGAPVNVAEAIAVDVEEDVEMPELIDLPLDPEPHDPWMDKESDTSSESDQPDEENAQPLPVHGKGKEREDDEIAVSAMLTQTSSEQTLLGASTQLASDNAEGEPDPHTEELSTENSDTPDLNTSLDSSKLENDLSLPSSFAFSSPETASHSVESSLDGTRPPSTLATSSLLSSGTESPLRSSSNFAFTFTPPAQASELPGAKRQRLHLPDRPSLFNPAPSTAALPSPLALPSPSINAPTPLPYPFNSPSGSTSQPVAGPSRARPLHKTPRRAPLARHHLSASTPAFDKTAPEFNDFRFSFSSSTPTTIAQSSSRQSNRPPLPPSTPGGVDEPSSATASGTSSPGLALYRPPEEVPNVRGYFDRDAKAKSSTQESEAALTPETERGQGLESERAPDAPVVEPVAEPAPPALIEEAVVRAMGDAIQAAVQNDERLAMLQDDDIEEEMQDLDPVGDDDMDGALEAIGVRGPITSVFQNVFLMIFIIDLAIAAGIWMPFTMGKTTALLFLQPEDVLAIIRFPILAVRTLTDPIVDSFWFLLNLLARPLKWGLIPVAAPAAKKAAPIPRLGLNFTAVQTTILHHWDRLLAHSQAAANASIPRPSPTNPIERVVFKLPAPPVRSLESIESRFAALGQTVRLFSHAFARRWQQLAVADGGSERAFAIGLGYLVLTLVMGLYLGVLNAGAVKGAAKALRNAVKQQLVVIKVALFIGLELLVFPTGCGIVLDAATLPLFESATLANRIAFYDFAPLTAFFCHWLVGTIFMYQFALTLGACRKVMRPGAMWFIKDPQDASFSPIRDILDKHVLTQLRKLAVSAVMYTLVIVIAVGGVAYTLRYTPVFSGVLPLRGSMRPLWGVSNIDSRISEPLSEIPVDLLFLHIVVPPSVKRLTIGEWAKSRLEQWWRIIARELRLSSFMFDELYEDELVYESTTRGRLIASENQRRAFKGQVYGKWLRVPKSDNIAFLRDAPVLIEVDGNDRPVRERGRQVMAAQDEETRRAGRRPDQDYMVIHVPPWFGTRCIALVAALWFTTAAIVVSGTAGPILLGRWLLAKTTGQTHLHDGYALVVGWYVLWGVWRVDNAMRAGMSVGRAVRWCAQMAWLGFWLGIVMPVLVAVALEVYIILPLRVYWTPGLVPVIRVAEEWSIGLVLMKIGWQAWKLRARPRNVGANANAGRNEQEDEVENEADRRIEELGRAMEQIVRHPLGRPGEVGATRAFILPVCGGLAMMILGPAAGLWALEQVVRGPQWGRDVLLTVVYPGIFCGSAVVGLWRVGRRAGRRWLQGVRDEEFLVEMRLRNLETK